MGVTRALADAMAFLQAHTQTLQESERRYRDQPQGRLNGASTRSAGTARATANCDPGVRPKAA